MSWPTPQDYNEAIQSPTICFGDAELKEGRVETNALGLPRAMTGAFASVYKIVCPKSTWAVRCFLTNRADLKERYLRISDFVLFDDLECTMDFYYMDKGIKVKGTWYPILKMKWVDGTNLDQYLNKNFSDGPIVRRLIDQFYHMAMELERAGIAHGDLQHGNIMVTDAGMRLVDYDALYVPALSGRTSLEVGHPNYQHPQRNEFHYDTTVDHFSMWLIHLSLLAVAIDPLLFEDLGGGDECILLRRSDLLNPESSPRFKRLLEHPSTELQQAAALVLKMLWVSPEIIPPLNATSEDLSSLPEIKVVESVGESDGEAPVSLSGSGRPQANPSSFSNQETMTRDVLLPSSTNRYESIPNNQLVYKPKKEKRDWRRFTDKISKQSQALTKWFLTGISPAAWHIYISKQGDSCFKKGEYDNAIKAYAQAYSVYEDSGEQFSELVLEDLFRLGRSFALTNNMSLANNYFLTASRLAARAKDDGDTSRADFLLAVCKGICDEHSEALEKLKVIPRLRTHLEYIIAREIPGKLICHPSVFRLLAQLGRVNLLGGFKDAGKDFYEAALSVFAQIHQGASSQLVSEGANIMKEVGLLYLEKGLRSNAESYFGRAALILEPLPDSKMQLLSVSFLLLSVQIHLSRKGQAEWLYERVKALSVEDIEVAWQNLQPGKVSIKIAEVLDLTAEMLTASGNVNAAGKMVSISWRLLLSDANFSPYKQATWLERFDEPTITCCLKSSFLNDASKFKSYPSALIEEFARKSNSKAALAYAGLLTELSLASSTGGARNNSNRNLYMQQLENLARSMILNSTVARIVETIAYSSQKNYLVLIDAIVQGFAHSNRIDTLISIACKLADNSHDEIAQSDETRLVSFDHLLASVVETNSKRTIEKTIAGLVRNEVGKVLIGSAVRLSRTHHDVVASIVAEFARQNDDWSLDQLVNSLVENHNLDALEHASTELATRWKTNSLHSIATKLARKNQFDSFDRVVSAVMNTDRSRSVVLLSRSLAEAELEQGFIRLLELIPEKNQSRYFAKIAVELAEHCPGNALQRVIDKIIEGRNSHSLSDVLQCLVRFKRITLLSQVACKLIADGQAEIVQRELFYLADRNAEVAALLAYEIVAAQREISNDGQLQIVNKLLKQNHLQTISWLIYLLARNQNADWLESVASSVTNHRRLHETKGIVEGQSGRAFLESAIGLAREKFVDPSQLTPELWKEQIDRQNQKAT